MKKRILVFSLVIFGVLSCKKDKTPLTGECSNFKFPETGIIYDYYMYGKQYMSPCFNPNNSNEFVYYFRDYDNGTTQLKKYNIATGENSVIVNSGKIHGQPKWGKNGWIAYTSAPAYVGHIYVVKDNGDSLRQFTDNLHNLSPVWSDTSNDLYWVHSPDLGSQWYYLKQNLNENQSDTIAFNGFQSTDILNNKILLTRNIEPAGYYGAPSYFGYYDLDTYSAFTIDNFIPFIKVNVPYVVQGICWSNTNSAFFYTSNKDGLYMVNSQTGQPYNLIPFCDSKRYETISCSSDGKYLVAERVDSSIESGKIIEKRKIYLIDLVTLKEIEVNLE